MALPVKGQCGTEYRPQLHAVCIGIQREIVGQFGTIWLFGIGHKCQPGEGSPHVRNDGPFGAVSGFAFVIMLGFHHHCVMLLFKAVSTAPFSPGSIHAGYLGHLISSAGRVPGCISNVGFIHHVIPFAIRNVVILLGELIIVGKTFLGTIGPVVGTGIIFCGQFPVHRHRVIQRSYRLAIACTGNWMSWK